MTFEELEHMPHPFSPGTQAKAFFSNGYGASVIRTEFSYGRESGLYELAVLKGDAEKHGITYETPITEDVIGSLTPSEVTELLQRIEALEAKP